MKTLSILLTTLTTITIANASDYIRFAERLSDVQLCLVDEGERFCEVVTRNSGGFTAKLTLPGVESVPFQAGTLFSVSLGGLAFDANLGDADVLTTNRAIFLLQYYDDNDRLRRYGAFTVSRSGNVLSIVAGELALDSSIVAENGDWDAHGLGTATFAGSFGATTFERTIYFKAVATQRPPPDADSDPLRTIVVLGKADFTKPTVTVTAPKNRARVVASDVSFQGTAKDNVSVASVFFRVGNDPWMPATGTSNWSATVSLPVGTNVVQVKSVDAEMQESRPVSRTVIRTQ